MKRVGSILAAATVFLGGSLVLAAAPPADPPVEQGKDALAGPKPREAARERVRDRVRDRMEERRHQDGPATRPHPRPEPGLMVERILDTLKQIGASEEQIAKAKALFDDAKSKFEAAREKNKEALEALRAEGRKLRQELKAAHEARNVEKVKELTGQLREQAEKFRTLMGDVPRPMDLVRKIKEDILGPELRAKLQARLDEMREKWQDRRPGGPRGPGEPGGPRGPGKPGGRDRPRGPANGAEAPPRPAPPVD